MRLGLTAATIGLGLAFATAPAFVPVSIDQAFAASRLERAATRDKCRAQARVQKISLFKRSRFLKNCMSNKGA